MGKYSAQVRDLRAGNWFWSQNAILDQYVAPKLLTPSEAMVYFALCRLARESAISAGVLRIAELSGTSERHTRAALGKLHDLGLIDIERRSDADAGSLPSVYTLVDVSPTPGAIVAPPGANRRATPVQPLHPPVQPLHPFNTRTQDVTKEEEISRVQTLLSRAERIAANVVYAGDEPLSADELAELRRSPVGRAGLRRIGL